LTRKPLSIKKLRELERVTVDFIETHTISCEEKVNQCDDVIINAYDLIAELCEIAGYHEWEDE